MWSFLYRLDFELVCDTFVLQTQSLKSRGLLPWLSLFETGGINLQGDGLGETDRESSEREDQNKREGVRKTSLGEKNMMIELDKAKSTIWKENR